MSTTASLLVLGALSLVAPQEDGSTRAKHAQAAVVSTPRAAQRAGRNPVAATNPQRVAPPSRVAPRVRLVPVPLNPTAPFWQAMVATGTSGLLGVANGGILPPAPSQMLSPGSLNVGVVMLDPASVPAGAPNTELFLIYRPHNPAGGRAPVLVHFHAYARSPADLIETDFLQEAMARDWYLVAPLQREPSAAPDDIHYSSVASQEYAKAAIDFTLAQPGTDPDRIFAYGFSMGGGAALNYAARHTALDDNRFAAIACHTGSLGLADVYDNVLGTAAEDHLEDIFGGPPSARPFEYLRSSVIELDGSGTAIMGGLHTVNNVAHLPIRVHFATQDPNQYLVEQARQFEAVLSNISAPIYQVFEDQLVTTHTWQLLNAAQACQWFVAASNPGVLPTSGTFVGDRERDHLGFLPDIRNAGQMARFDWALSGTNSVEVTQTENLVQVTVDLVARGLDPNAASFFVEIDANGDQYRVNLAGMPRPTVARRTALQNGVPLGSAVVVPIGPGSDVQHNSFSNTLLVRTPANAVGPGVTYRYEFQ